MELFNMPREIAIGGVESLIGVVGNDVFGGKLGKCVSGRRQGF